MTVDLSAFYLEQHPGLINYCRRFTHGDRDRAEDYAQDAWLRLFEWRERSYDPTYPPRRVLYGEAWRNLVDTYRHERRYPLLPLDIREGGGWSCDVTAAAEEIDTQIDLSTLYGQIMLRLTPAQAQAFELWLSSVSQQEAAEQLGISCGAYRVRVHAALGVVRRFASHE